jgi:hypothetical protein
LENDQTKIEHETEDADKNKSPAPEKDEFDAYDDGTGDLEATPPKVAEAVAELEEPESPN